MIILYVCIIGFWLIWFINQRALYNHALFVLHRRRWHHLCTPLITSGFNRETFIADSAQGISHCILFYPFDTQGRSHTLPACLSIFVSWHPCWAR